MTVKELADNDDFKGVDIAYEAEAFVCPDCGLEAGTVKTAGAVQCAMADAMTGQDAVNVAEHFNELLDITGVFLTKMEGDARGGAALSIKAVTNKPIKFIGVGEKVDAIEPFHPDRIGILSRALFIRTRASSSRPSACSHSAIFTSIMARCSPIGAAAWAILYLLIASS